MQRPWFSNYQKKKKISEWAQSWRICISSVDVHCSGLNCSICPKRYVQVLSTGICECDLIWNRVFAYKSKLKILRWDHPRFRVNPLTEVFIREKRWFETKKHSWAKPCEDWQRLEISCCKASYPWKTKNYEPKKDIPLDLWRELGPVNILILDCSSINVLHTLQKCERIHFWYFNSWSFW
jgi:hypothetical protein